MKKILLIIGICATLISMTALAAMPTTTFTKTIKTLPTGDYNGTFAGGIGRVYKAENGSWDFDCHGYLAGVYKGGKYKRVLGNLYNLDQEQIGYIGFISTNKFLIGKIKNMQNQSAPIMGFIFYNDQYFIGRIMSFVGPAPHIWGAYTPN